MTATSPPKRRKASPLGLTTALEASGQQLAPGLLAYRFAASLYDANEYGLTARIGVGDIYPASSDAVVAYRATTGGASTAPPTT